MGWVSLCVCVCVCSFTLWFTKKLIWYCLHVSGFHVDHMVTTEILWGELQKGEGERERKKVV